MFSLPTPPPERRQDLELPPMFFVAPSPLPYPEPQVTAIAQRIVIPVSLTVEPRLRAALDRVLSTLAYGSGEAAAEALADSLSGGELLLPSRMAGMVLHRAVLAIVGNTALDFETREAALELIKRIEAAAGIHPQQGLLELAQQVGIWHPTRGHIGAIDLLDVKRRPLQIGKDARGVGALIDAFPSLFVRIYSQASREFIDNNMIRYYEDWWGDEDDEQKRIITDQWRHHYAMGDAMGEFRDELRRAGFDAELIYPNGHLETDQLAVMWREPGYPVDVQIVEVLDTLWYQPGFTESMIAGTAELGPEDWGVGSITLRDPSWWDELVEEGYLYNPRGGRP
jgi:hypothetical protein